LNLFPSGGVRGRVPVPSLNPALHQDDAAEIVLVPDIALYPQVLAGKAVYRAGRRAFGCRVPGIPGELGIRRGIYVIQIDKVPRIKVRVGLKGFIGVVRVGEFDDRRVFVVCE